MLSYVLFTLNRKNSNNYHDITISNSLIYFINLPTHEIIIHQGKIPINHQRGLKCFIYSSFRSIYDEDDKEDEEAREADRLGAFGVLARLAALPRRRALRRSTPRLFEPLRALRRDVLLLEERLREADREVLPLRLAERLRCCLREPERERLAFLAVLESLRARFLFNLIPISLLRLAIILALYASRSVT